MFESGLIDKCTIIYQYFDSCQNKQEISHCGSTVIWVGFNQLLTKNYCTSDYKSELKTNETVECSDEIQVETDGRICEKLN